MSFNSIDFGLFFPLVFVLYWSFFGANIRLRNVFLIIVSYFFYGFWDWRFLSLIAMSSAVDFIIGKKIHEEEDQKKQKSLLLISLIVNLGFLGVFKYLNFFIDSFVDTFTLLGMDFQSSSLNIILPVGISFYTFQTLSYTIDIYYKKIEPTKDVFAFFAFVSFFPQLVAGPIERAKNLLPQFQVAHKSDYNMIKSGLLLIAWGLFKKVVVADRLAKYIDTVYADSSNIEGLPLLIAVVFFAFQLYLDFSAYSDIAIGIARTLGFRLSLNFRRPYLSLSFSDFWERWHISLSSWFKDYVYIPLGGSKKGKKKTKRNIFIVFLLSGMWHGAAWNFLIWGALNALFLLYLESLLLKINKVDKTRVIAPFIVFSAWALSLIFFRSETFKGALEVLANLGNGNADLLYNYGLGKLEFQLTAALLLLVLVFEIFHERKKNIYDWFISFPIYVRWMAYILVAVTTILIGVYGSGVNDSNFIYFQF